MVDRTYEKKEEMTAIEILQGVFADIEALVGERPKTFVVPEEFYKKLALELVGQLTYDTIVGNETPKAINLEGVEIKIE